MKAQRVGHIVSSQTDLQPNLAGEAVVGRLFANLLC